MTSTIKYILFLSLGAILLTGAVVLARGTGLTSTGTNTVSLNSAASQWELMGKWYRGEGSLYAFPTGAQYGPGTRFTYEFFPDGTVEYKMDRLAKNAIQCDFEEIKSRKGKYTINDETITVNFGETSFYSSDRCIEKDNFNKTLPAETVTLKWKLKSLYGKSQLYLQDENGEFVYIK